MQASKSFAWRREWLVTLHWLSMKRLASNTEGLLPTIAPTLSASSWKDLSDSFPGFREKRAIQRFIAFLHPTETPKALRRPRSCSSRLGEKPPKGERRDRQVHVGVLDEEHSGTKILHQD